MTQIRTPEWSTRARAALNREGGRPLIAFLQRQRWFGGKGAVLDAVHISEAIVLPCGTDRRLLALATIDYRDGRKERYAMPLSIRPGIGPGDPDALVEWPDSSDSEWICDATQEAGTWMALYEAVAQEQILRGEAGSLKGRALPQGQGEWSRSPNEAKVLCAEQSNTSVIFDQRVILKLLRKVETGINPDSEMLEFLTTHTPCLLAPPLFGVLSYGHPTGDESGQSTVAILQRFLSNSMDGWKYTLAHLQHLLAEGPGARQQGHTLEEAVTAISAPFQEDMRRLGALTGELHLALASQLEPDSFRPEPITLHDVDQWQAQMRQLLARVCGELRALQPARRSALKLTEADVTRLETACPDWFEELRSLPHTGACKIRHHGDYHLGQVLKTSEGFAVIDFEGEPARPLVARRAKVCPLKDVAGMLRSFGYAAQVSSIERGGAFPAAAWMEEWERTVRVAFLEGYRSTARPGEALFLPKTWEATVRIIHVYEVDKVLYELDYELQNRPDWLQVPLTGMRRLCQGVAGLG